MSKEGLDALKYARIVDYTTDVALGKREPNKKLEESFNIIEKDLKALEIIKKFAKSIDLKYIFCGNLLIIIIGDEFEYWYKCETQEEYDLLKEVLEK